MQNKQKYTIEQGKTTRFEILEAGLRLWPDVTPSSVAKALHITHASVIYHFPDIKTAVANYAVAIGFSRVIVQLIAVDDESVKNMSEKERKKHLMSLV